MYGIIRYKEYTQAGGNMIEIVQAGTYANKEKKKYRVQCWNCGTIFRFNLEDSIRDPLEHREFISCPVCGRMTKPDMWIENRV